MDKEDIVKLYIKEARKYVGTPFKHQGRDKNGMDCIGIITVPLNNIGFFEYDNINYRRYGLGGEIIEILNKYCYEISIYSKLEPGDILMFSKGRSQHLAIYTGESIIHANNSVGKVTEHILDDYWMAMVSRVFRYREDIQL
jgi:cell wall-associated NlpC family hydrolase